MIPVTIFAGRDVAILGLGLSGLAAARALAAGGANPILWDDAVAAREEAASHGFAVNDLASADWSRFAALVLAPGIPLTHPKPHWSVARARDASVEVIGDIELFFRERARLRGPGKVVVITGTNGKSTTTALTAHLLAAAGKRVAFGGNIGKAVLDLDPFEEFKPVQPLLASPPDEPVPQPLQDDDYPLEYYEDSYPKLPACLDRSRKPEPLAEAA